MANWIQRFLTAIATHKADASAHHAKTTAGELNLADLAEKAHGSLTGVTAAQHHAKTTLFSTLTDRWTLAQAHRGADGKIMVFKGPAANPVEEDIPAGLSSKVKTATRALDAASGDVAYTGIGFIPSVIIAFAAHWRASVDMGASWGVSDSVLGESCLWFRGDSMWDSGSYIVAMPSENLPQTKGQTAIVKSYDADGFTLTWSKNGEPTASTAKLVFLCLK